MKSILVASKNQIACETLRGHFGSEYEVEVVSTERSCLVKFKQKRREFTFVDVEFLRKPDSTKASDHYTEALEELRKIFPTAVIIVLSSQTMIREAVRAVKAGADDYLTYPIHEEELRFVIDSLHESIRMKSELDYLRDSFREKDALGVFQTKSPVMERVFEKILSVAPTKSTVLLTGETGTGKGLLANFMHRHSHRRNAQFISVHCGAIPDTLVESELFGHEKGAFTGADRRKLGKFEIAHGGTIFLDEIATITPSAQIKLLRVLQDRTFQRVGGEIDIEVDVRIVAATNADLKKLCDSGLFRSDLYYRLSVFPIEIPPLRVRKEDIPSLAEYFLEKMKTLYLKRVQGIHDGVLRAFQNYSWPGNIRELENLIERAYIIESSSVLTAESVPRELFTPATHGPEVRLEASLPLAEVRRRGVETLEQAYLKQLLMLNKGRIQKTAEAAGISSRQLSKLMKKHCLNKEGFK
jgi:DNA-binding NtrC family response regulator